MSKIKNGGLDQYGAEPFEQQQFGTVGAEWVNGISFLIYFASLILIRLFPLHLLSHISVNRLHLRSYHSYHPLLFTLSTILLILPIIQIPGTLRTDS